MKLSKKRKVAVTKVDAAKIYTLEEATKLMKDKMAGLGVPDVKEYLQMLVDGGAKLYACKMSVDMFDLKKEDFIDGVEAIVTAGDFMDMTEGAQIIFI